MRTIWVCVAVLLWLGASGRTALAEWTGVVSTQVPMDPNKFSNWLSRWKSYISSSARNNRYCDTVMGEDIGWYTQPYLNGFYYGYLATKDANWVLMEANWADSWIKRKLTEPDGYPGWPKVGAAGTDVDKLNSYYADSLLGEAMALTPIVRMAGEILKTPSLSAVYGAKAQGYIDLSEQIYSKWASRGAFRDTAGGGAISLVLPYGIDANTWTWTAKYALRNDPAWGFSHPDNKANKVAMWLTAMWDVTGDANYRNHAEDWYTLMKSRMTPLPNGTYQIWNYWQPAGSWDYDPNGNRTKHWVGVHPNSGYYDIDVTAIVDAYQHGLVFTRVDIDRLVATALAGHSGWTSQPYWAALTPYSVDLQRAFEANFPPDSWSGLGTTPWYLSLQVGAIPEPACLALMGAAAALLGRRRPRRRPARPTPSARDDG